MRPWELFTHCSKRPMVGEVVSNLSRCSRPESTPRRTCTILFSLNRAIECGRMVLIGVFRVVSTCWSIGRPTFPGSDFMCSHRPCIYAPCLLVYLLNSHCPILLSLLCRQFERTFRYVQSLDKYDAMFLMESDTYPAADGWLDLLIEEVKSSAPFALLGR